MIEADHFYAAQIAGCNGHLDVLNYLKEKAPDTFQDMIAVDDFSTFRAAAANAHLAVVQYLLKHSGVFAYAEAHQREYADFYVHPFVAKKMMALRIHRQEVEENNLDAVFDVASPEDAKLLFYVVRNLIRRNDSALTQGEQQQLQAVIDRYQPLLKQAGVS